MNNKLSARTKPETGPAITAPMLPAVGQRVGVVCGPGEQPRDNAGTVQSIVKDRWGSHAVIQMDAGDTRTCHRLNRGPGIGWHTL